MKAFRILSRAIWRGQKKQSSPNANVQPAPIPPAATLADLKPHLRTLLSGREVSDPAVRDAEANIKRIGDICGVYLTASAVQSYAGRLSPTDDAEKKNARPRGFELAGELYYIHLRKEVDIIEEKTGSLGPTVFRSYCTELFDCFLAGEHVRKGVGYPTMLMETLFGKALVSPDKKGLYLALADQAMQSMEELSRRKFEKDTVETLRAAREELKDDALMPETKDPHEIIDRKLFDYLQRLQKGYGVVRAALEETKFTLTASDSAGEMRNRVAYLHAILNAKAQGQYLGLTAIIKEILGRTLHTARQKNYREYVLAAAQDLERLADDEQDLHLVVMSAQHYRKAHELYSFAEDPEKAEAARGKLERLKARYDPQMLIISQL